MCVGLKAQEHAAKARTEEAVSLALKSIDEALSHNNAPYCESLLALKANMLLGIGQHAAAASLASRHQSALEPGMAQPVWPHWVIVQSYYFDGNLPAVCYPILWLCFCLCLASTSVFASTIRANF